MPLPDFLNKKTVLLISCISFFISVFLIKNVYKISTEKLLSIKILQPHSFIESQEKNESNNKIPQEHSLIQSQEKNESKNKVILVWNSLWNIENWGFNREPAKDFKAAKCKVTNCVVVDDKHKLLEADAVLFHLDLEDRPRLKPPDQRWVFFSHEPVSLYPVKPYHNLVNWVLNYRLDADIYTPYYNFFKRKTPIKIDCGAILKSKKKLAAWFVSKCKTSSKRENYVHELMKYMPVDVYGKCSINYMQNNSCNPRGSCRKDDILNTDYKFYLAFENTLFKDYVTEKYFQMLNLNVVPVVRGDGNYSVVGPPNSSINTKDFPTVEKLANYLLYLDKNDDEYIKYLEYKENYILDNISGFHTSFCHLCEKLNNPSEPYKVYDNLEKWLGNPRAPNDISNAE